MALEPRRAIAGAFKRGLLRLKSPDESPSLLNRHALVLVLGIAAWVLLRAVPPSAYGLLGAAFLCLAIGLLLDSGIPEGPRTVAAHLLQAVGASLLVVSAALLGALGTAGIHLALVEVGIALVAFGVLAEMRVDYAKLKAAVLLQVVGDLCYLAGAATAFWFRKGTPSTSGWVFIALAGLLGVYAAGANLALQIGRLRNLQAGWRFRVLGMDEGSLRLKTPGSEARIPWRHVEAVKKLDARHLLLVLPAPLPGELQATGLPFEELRTNAEALVPETAPPPDRYGFVLHEQELGMPLSQAEATLRTHLVTG